MRPKKSILIFGGGLNQLTLIQAAKDSNVTSVVIDPNRDALGSKYADFFEVVAADDLNKTLEIAKKYKVDGIVTSQMENPLYLMAAVAEELNYIFPKKEVIDRSRNKFLMKRFFINNGLPCAKGILIESGKILNALLFSGLDYPLILKPVDSHSSRGVLKVYSFKEIENNLQNTSNYSSNGSILVEEFLEGKEYSIEAVTYKGKTEIIQFTEKIITDYPYAVELGHIQPAELTDYNKIEISKIVKAAISSLGIDNSLSHTEIIITKAGPKIVEIGARGGGDFIASYLTLASTGVNMDKTAIQIALGKSPDLTKRKHQYAYAKYIMLAPGRKIVEIEPCEDICLKNINCVYANIFISSGEKIPEITDSSKRVGVVIAKAESREFVLKKALRYEGLLKDKIILEKL